MRLLQILLNDRPLEVEDDIDVLTLLESKGFNPNRSVVELNDERVAKREWSETKLKSNDKVVIIRIVSGG